MENNNMTLEVLEDFVVESLGNCAKNICDLTKTLTTQKQIIDDMTKKQTVIEEQNRDLKTDIELLKQSALSIMDEPSTSSTTLPTAEEQTESDGHIIVMNRRSDNSDSDTSDSSDSSNSSTSSSSSSTSNKSSSTNSSSSRTARRVLPAMDMSTSKTNTLTKQTYLVGKAPQSTKTKARKRLSLSTNNPQDETAPKLITEAGEIQDIRLRRLVQDQIQRGRHISTDKLTHLQAAFLNVSCQDLKIKGESQKLN